jgi:2-iminobutanoate/2-iminopropanoate deaminase
MKTRLNPPNANTMAAYSQGMKIDLGNSYMVLLSGQIALDASGNAVAPNDIEKQTRYIFESIKTVLAQAEASIEDVVKAQIFLTDMSQYPKVSAIRNEYFAKVKPVSTLIEINRTVKEGCDIEIEVMAIVAKEKHVR